MSGLRALVLAGGRGTRFWPLSRRARPKQLLSLVDNRSLLEHTLTRLAPLVESDDIWICTTEDLSSRVLAQAPRVAPERVLAEPLGRNTAPAIAWSVSVMAASTGDRCIVVLPSDHWVADPAAFRRALEVGHEAVEREDAVVTFGVPPRWAETGFGYIEVETEVTEPGKRPETLVARGFVEKPDAETARRFVDSGRFLWNSGIFLFRASLLIELTRKHMPELADGLDEVVAHPDRLPEIYARLPAESIDHGIMEKLDHIQCVPLDCGWSDLGSLAALEEVLPAPLPTERESPLVGASGVSPSVGDVIEIDGRGNVLVADHGTVAVLGIEGLIVVRTEDAVVVLPKERAQEVRRVVEELERRGSNLL